MTAELEFTGRNIQKAVQQAAKTLGIPDTDIKYDILSHGSTGIFGLAGIKKARIKVHATDKLIYTTDDVSGNNDAVVGVVEEDKARHEEQLPPDEGQRVGEAVLRRIVDAISPESIITIETSSRRCKFYIEGGQSGILIGKKGQTLDAIQLIVDKAVRRLNGHKIRYQVDVEGYLAKKKIGLVHTAKRLSKKVVAKGTPASAGYLNAQDRRTIHLALKNDQKVRTQSVGEGPLRKLMIYPRRKPKTRT
jgi:spoIIIJ-associated protein